MPNTCDDCRTMLAALRELRSAAISFRNAAYDAEPRLVVGNEAVNRLSATLFAAGKLIDAMKSP